MIADLPVAVALPAPLDADVGAWAEGDLGWQVVEAHGALTPALALSDGPVGRLPWIAVSADPLDERTVTALLRAGAEDVVAWPRDRDRIPVVATRIAIHRRSAAAGSRLSVAGVAGGVGTSTIALAIAGRLAWGGAQVLAVGDDLLALASAGGHAPGVARSHHAVAGVPRLSVAGHRVDVDAWAGDVVVVDAGTQTSAANLLIARPDRALERAAQDDRPVVVNGDAPMAPAVVRRVLGRDPAVQLPWSARVARAGVLGRVPAALPGRWLRALGAGLRALDGVSA